MLHMLPTQRCHPSHPVRGSVEGIMRHLTEDTAEFSAFNAGYVKMHRRRPAIDHDAIKNPLNRLMSYGVAKLGPPILVTKAVYDEAAALMEYATQVLGARH